MSTYINGYFSAAGISRSTTCVIAFLSSVLKNLISIGIIAPKTIVVNKTNINVELIKTSLIFLIKVVTC